MTDRIKPNHSTEVKGYGPLNELCVSGCDVHLEQMSERGFCLVLTRGEEQMRVAIYAPGTGRVHARAEVDSGFAGLRDELKGVR